MIKYTQMGYSWIITDSGEKFMDIRCPKSVFFKSSKVNENLVIDITEELYANKYPILKEEKTKTMYVNYSDISEEICQKILISSLSEFFSKDLFGQYSNHFMIKTEKGSISGHANNGYIDVDEISIKDISLVGKIFKIIVNNKFKWKDDSLMIYGIDLGTTYSLLSLYDSNIKESRDLVGLFPSVVNLHTGTAGLEKYYTEDVISSFKIDMTINEVGRVSVKASACVLTGLAKHMKEKRAVISVPAYFSDPQRKAVIKSAEIAGIKVEALINEPTAAALYYNKDKKDCSVIYDLGGGTFDATVIDSRYGIYDVNVTKGRILGGDNLDRAILNRLYYNCKMKQHKINTIIEMQMLSAVEKMKIEIQNKGYAMLSFPEYKEAFEITDFEMDAYEYKKIVEAVFGVTLIDLRTIITASGYSLDDLKLILVGGSTRDPYLVELIGDIKEPEPLDYNPDKIVAQGAAYYAYLLENGLARTMVSDVTKGLSIELDNGYVKYIIPENSKIPIKNTTLVQNSITADKLVVNLLQGNSGIAQNNSCIGQLIYDYGVIKEAGKGQVTVTVNVSADGIITLTVKAPLKKEQVINIS